MQRRAAVLAALARRLAAACEPAPASAAAIAWSPPPLAACCSSAAAPCRSFATAAPALKEVARHQLDITERSSTSSSSSSSSSRRQYDESSRAGPAAAASAAVGRPPVGSSSSSSSPSAAAAAGLVDRDDHDHAHDDNEAAAGFETDDDFDDEGGGGGGGSSAQRGKKSVDPLTAALRSTSLDDAARAALTPAEIVRRLDEHVVGQAAAKRAVAVALRNRWRRQRLAGEHRREVAPRGLLLVGPTGSGKTEIARRLARLGDAPFVATSATRYTELGYVGADVEDMVKELAEEALRLTKRRVRDALRRAAARRAERAIVRALCGPRAPAATVADFARLYRAGALDELPVSAEALGAAGDGAAEDDDDGEEEEEGGGDVTSGGGGGAAAAAAAAAAPSRAAAATATAAGKPRRRASPPPSSSSATSPPLPPTPAGGPTLRVADAREALLEREVARRLDAGAPLLQREALRLASEEGIIFIDEIDKIVEPGAAQRAAAGREGGGGWATGGGGGGGGGGGRGGGVSSEGVQRDLLPILEGTVVPTKLGPLDTTHVLFVCAGAFHQARPSDMLGELQGRLPVRVRLSRMSRRDLLRVLTEPRHALRRQHEALLRSEGVDLRFTDAALQAVARCAAEANRLLDDLGARRLGTVLERVLRGVSYDAPAMVAAAREERRRRRRRAAEAGGAAADGEEEEEEGALVPYVVDEADVERAMAEVLAVPDLSRHML
jgi:ATP-dependent HslUV protease ATP-binding subunit HslU